MGAGLMGRWHLHYARRHGAVVAAVVDRSREAASRLALRAGHAPVFDDMDAMVAATRPHVVHICTPLQSHLPLALQAVAAGAHALVEKPLTPFAAQAGELLQEARVRGVNVCPVHQFAFQRGVARVAMALEELGEPLHASFTICSAGGAGQAGDTLDAIVAEILPHPLSVLQALWPQHALRPEDWSARSPSPGELVAQGSAGAMPVGVRISMNARPTRCDMELLCRLGSVHVNFFHGYAVVRRGRPSRLDKIAQPFRLAGKTIAVAAANLAGRAFRGELAYPGLGALIGHFHAAARNARGNPIPPEHTLAAARVREQVMRQAMPRVLGESPGGRDPGDDPGSERRVSHPWGGT